MKLRMARESSWAAWIASKARGKTELNVNRLTATLFSNLSTICPPCTAGYKCNHEHGWIDHDMCNKTSLLNISRLYIE